MASSATIRPNISKFFALPSHLRLKIYQQTRSFSATTSNKVNLVDIAIAGPNALLDGIHTLGIPWSATIPISAILVRTVLVHYISTRPARKRAQLRNQLLPLASARLTQEWYYGSDGAARRKRRADSLTSPTLSRLRRINEPWQRMFLGMKIMRRLTKQFGGGGFRPWGLLNFGMLVAFTEAIRMKCGTREGLLPLLLSPFTWLGRWIFPSYFPEPLPPTAHGPSIQLVTEDPAELLAGKLWAAREALNAETQSSENGAPEDEAVPASQENFPDEVLSQTTPEIPPTTMNSYFDPTMQTEGLPWIIDLTLPDPTIILPSTLFLGLLANSILRPRPGDKTPAENYSLLRGLNRGQRIGIVIACVFGFASVKMPAAVLLYFGPSIIAGWLHGRWLDYKYPIIPAIQPCKRPVRMEARQRR